MNEAIIVELNRKMDMLIALTAIGVLADKTQKEQIEALNRAGLQPKEIAQLVGTSSNTVSVTLSQMKKAKNSPRIVKP